MKKFGIAVASAILLYSIPVCSQTIKIKSVKNNSILETTGTIIFDNTNIDLENVTINCKEVNFSENVRKIKISGVNKIKCADIKLQANSSPIEINSKEGDLIIEYTGNFVDTGRELVITNVRSTKIAFKKI